MCLVPSLVLVLPFLSPVLVFHNEGTAATAKARIVIEQDYIHSDKDGRWNGDKDMDWYSPRRDDAETMVMGRV